MASIFDADPSFSPRVVIQRSILIPLCLKSVGFLDMDVRSGPGIETYTIFRFLDPDSLAIIGDYQFFARRFSGPTETVFTLVAKLIEVEVLFETGDFTESRNTDTFRVSVTDYDPTCEDGTDAFALGSRDSTSSPEDKLP